MESNKILQSDFLDILFDEKNKQYGAYELRRSYDKRIIKALCITGIAIGLAIGSTLIARPTNEDTIMPDDNGGLVIRPYDEVEVPRVEPPPPPPKPIEPPQMQTIAFVEPVVSPDDQVFNTPPAQDDFDGVKISDLDRIGVKGGDDISTPPEIINKVGIIEEKKKLTDEPWIGPVEIEAEFPGGAKEWERFLRRNLQADIPIDNNAAPGRYTVYLQFIVDKEGRVSDIKALTAHGFGMEEEAMRVLRKATKWNPANQNGRAVKAYRKQPITFVVEP